MSRYHTDFVYTDRLTKAEYVHRKYRPLVEVPRVLDVGADQCYLRRHLPETSDYLGVGIGDGPDEQVDLEGGALPFEVGAFDCVLCLDVLEHIENNVAIFGECCRVSRGHVIVSLPNPWGTFWKMLRKGPLSPHERMKFYGLPTDRPEDRHRWFFSLSEAEAWIGELARRGGMRVEQMDHLGGEQARQCGRGRLSGARRGLRTRLRRAAIERLLGRALPWRDLEAGTLWAVLAKDGSGATTGPRP